MIDEDNESDISLNDGYQTKRRTARSYRSEERVREKDDEEERLMPVDFSESQM